MRAAEGETGMAYPKPLAQKTIARLYAQAGLCEPQIAFARRFCTACANLYGCVTADEAWQVYRELSAKTQTVPLHRRDFYAALKILRRESLPFYVFEIDEIYSAEPRRDSLLTIAHRDLVGSGFHKFAAVYAIRKAVGGKPFYLPENLLTFVDPPQPAQEQKLLRLLGGLKSTRSRYKDRFGELHNCPYKGSEYDAYELDRLNGKTEDCKGNPKRAAALEAKLNSITAAQYLVRLLKQENDIGCLDVNEILDWFYDDLTAMGVLLTEEQLLSLLEAISEMWNNQHLWCNRGWTPNELSVRLYGGAPPTTVTFGSGMQAAFANGEIDKAALIRQLHELGLKTE